MELALPENHTFRLLTIPLELREMIYRHVFAENASDDGSIPNIASPALMRTSKQVRNEILPIFYSMCRFSVSMTTQEVPKFDAHVKILAANGFLKHVNRLTLSVKEAVTARDIRRTTKTIAVDFTTTNATAQAADSTLVCDGTVDFESTQEVHMAVWVALKANNLNYPGRQSFAVSDAFKLNLRDVLGTLGREVPKVAEGVCMQITDGKDELQSLRVPNPSISAADGLQTPPWWI